MGVELVPGLMAFKRASCVRKIRHSSLEEAFAIAADYNKNGNCRMKVYFCQFCGGFHLTSVTAKNKKVEPAAGAPKVNNAVNTALRDKMIAAGILNGTAPLARQGALTNLTPTKKDERKYFEYRKPVGWFEMVGRATGLLS